MEYDNIPNAIGSLPIRTTLIKYYVPIQYKINSTNSNNQLSDNY